MDIATLPPTMVMESDEMVNAVLARLDGGDTVTVPRYRHHRLGAYGPARQKLILNQSRSSTAVRYSVAAA